MSTFYTGSIFAGFPQQTHNIWPNLLPGRLWVLGSVCDEASIHQTGKLVQVGQSRCTPLFNLHTPVSTTPTSLSQPHPNPCPDHTHTLVSTTPTFLSRPHPHPRSTHLDAILQGPGIVRVCQFDDGQFVGSFHVLHPLVGLTYTHTHTYDNYDQYSPYIQQFGHNT